MMLTKRKTAGIRVPNNQICILLIQRLGHPILSTSATLPDGTVLHDPSLIHDSLNANRDLVIDGGPVPGNPSSVISLIDDYPKVLRKGLGDVGVFE
jgi:tRNA A37 threonylcarbamoyladenosine synthetase subunit TsaC/SUA5/YrdC